MRITTGFTIKSPGCALLFILVFYAIGAGVIWLGAASWLRANATRKWPAVDGQLEERHLKTTHDRALMYEVQMRYRYSVNGTTYEGTNIAIGYGASSTYKAHKMLHDKLMSGTTVQVRYNPHKPSEALLSCGANASVFMPIVFGVTFLSVLTGIVALSAISGCTDEALLRRLEVY